MHRNWLSIDARHAGDVVGVLEDGCLTLPLTEQAVMVQLPSGLQLVDDDQVVGWTVVCSCTNGWDAPRWARNFDGGQADPDRRVDGLRAGHPCNPLSNGDRGALEGMEGSRGPGGGRDRAARRTARSRGNCPPPSQRRRRVPRD